MFTVTAVDDSLDDGNQNVTISASASGYTGISDTILVIDDDEGGSGDDHGNSAASATLVSVPSTTSGDIEVGGDSDWFRFSAVAGTSYIMETILNGLADSTLTLYDKDGVTQLRYDDDGGTDRASLIQWSPTTSGTYYVAVKGFNAGYTGDYSLSVRADKPVVSGPVEPNDSFEEASVLTSEDQIYKDLAIDGQDDQDYYRWVAPRSGQLAVDILFADSEGDLDLKLYSSNQNRVAISDSLTDNEHIVYNVQSGETYYIQVLAVGIGEGSNVYDLVIDGP
jgi:hypothetical protein